MKYQPRLDSIRFFAVALVIFSHWLPNSELLKLFPTMGHVGVGIFFVLSGYLITGVLTRLKSKSLGRALKIFYFNRVLRIFPIYYLLLVLFFFIQVQGWATNYLYFLTYTTNFRIYEIGKWVGPFSHLWSLAIEEQFYLIWPILFLLIPAERYNLLIVGTFLISFILKFYFYVNLENSFLDMLPFSQFDLFMIGAWLMVNKKNLISKIKKINFYWTSCSLIIVFIIVVFFSHHFLISNLTLGLFSMLLILVTKYENRVTQIFEFKPFVFFGKISYGLYLFHNFIPLFERNLVGTEKQNILFNKVLPNINSAYYHLSIQLILLLTVSILSWYLIEKKFLKLKITNY
jgi:peptidoglycan/LPS O-acetylase OafA/YrhL